MRVSSRRLYAALFLVALAAVGCAEAPSNASRSSTSSWTQVPVSPLSPRYSAHASWVGERVVVLGGFASDPCPPNADCVPPAEPPLSDGASFDPETGTWDRIAEAPVPIGWASGGVVGDTLYLLVRASENWRATRAAFLAYSVTLDRWEELPMPPVGQEDTYVLAPYADRIMAYQSSQESGIRTDLEFDPSTRTWADLPADRWPRRSIARWSGRTQVSSC